MKPVGNILAAAMLAMWAVPQASADAADSYFADQVEETGSTLVLQGAAYARYLGFLKPLAAAFYLDEQAGPDDALANVPKRIEFRYFYSIPKERFIGAGDKALKASLPPDTLASIQAGIEQINRLYQDVKDGDRYCLTYLPGVGTRLELNGVLQGTIEGEAFGRHYFAIWLGERPFNKGLKKALIGASS